MLRHSLALLSVTCASAMMMIKPAHATPDALPGDSNRGDFSLGSAVKNVSGTQFPWILVKAEFNGIESEGLRYFWVSGDVAYSFDKQDPGNPIPLVTLRVIPVFTYRDEDRRDYRQPGDASQPDVGDGFNYFARGANYMTTEFTRNTATGDQASLRLYVLGWQFEADRGLQGVEYDENWNEKNSVPKISFFSRVAMHALGLHWRNFGNVRESIGGELGRAYGEVGLNFNLSRRTEIRFAILGGAQIGVVCNRGLEANRPANRNCVDIGFAGDFEFGLRGGVNYDGKKVALQFYGEAGLRTDANWGKNLGWRNDEAYAEAGMIMSFKIPRKTKNGATTAQ